VVPADPIVALKEGTVSVVSPAEVLDLVEYSSSFDSDPSEDSLPHVPDLPLVSPFYVLMIRRRTVSPSLLSRDPYRHFDTLAPLSEFPLAPVVAPPEIRRHSATLVLP
ncbi:hypothetical protein Tco_0521691, partial [Tanacetum coccineum]